MTNPRIVKNITTTSRGISSLIALSLTVSFFIWTVPGNTQAIQQNLDLTFGGEGKVTINTSKAFKIIRAIALQRNSKIIVAGDSSGKRGQGPFIGQLNRDGTLDTEFGMSGFADINFAVGAATAVAIQPDRRILVAGRAVADFGLARFKKGGSPDLSFGSGGIVKTDFFGRTDQAWAITLQQDGKIILAGSAGGPSGEQFALARYDADGSLDITFGDTGKVYLEFSNHFSQALAVTLQSDGKIVVAGLSSNENTNNDFAIARLNSAGRLDSSFGAEGKVTTAFSSGFDHAFGVMVQPDGNIVAVGEGDGKFALARYNTDGSLDSSFGNGGRVITDFFSIASAAFAAAIQADGKIIAAGRASKMTSGEGDDFALARYNTDGMLDASFGVNGKVIIDFFGNSDMASCIALQTDGKIILAGFARHPDFKYSLAIARLQGG